MFDLFVGDTDQSLAQRALEKDSRAHLLTFENIDNFLQNAVGTVYTCLGDIGELAKFQNLCLQAHEIFYCPPDSWSSLDMRKWTEYTLNYCSQTVLVHNLPNTHNQFLSNSQRQSQNPQLWIAGCSISLGVAVESFQTYGYLLEQEFKLRRTNLTQNGSSITWAGNQICQADIRKDDIVCWGLTGWDRMTHINQNELHHINSANVTNFKHIDPNCLTDINNVYLEIMAIKNVDNFCKKIGAKLVMLGLMTDWDSYFKLLDLPTLEQLTLWPAGYVDLGSDNMHPGPEQHKLFAAQFIKLYKKLYL